MGTRIMYDPAEDYAALYDSVSEQPFGPLFRGDSVRGTTAEDEAADFLSWLEGNDGRDARELTPAQISSLVERFRRAQEVNT